jgi:uncharacterized cupin superfamily protein
MSETKPSVVIIADLPVRTATIYPAEFSNEVSGRSNVALGNVFDITQFGVNITTLQPGAWSSHRHAHAEEDELAVALEGEMILVDNNGRHPFRPGMVAGFKAGNGNAHKVVNESNQPAKFLVVGTRSATESVEYADVDMKGVKSGGTYVITRKDGSSF